MTFAWQKLILFSLFVCKYFNFDDAKQRSLWIEYCLDDIAFCPLCFDQSARERCHSFLDEITLINSFSDNVNILFGSRRTQHARASNQLLFLKHPPNVDRMNLMSNKICGESTKCLADRSADASELGAKIKLFVLASERIDGIQRCANQSTTHFVGAFNRFASTTEFWLHVYMNPELVLLRRLADAIDVVPQVHIWNGFVVVESFAGRTLNSYYDRSTGVKLRIAKNLLLAAETISNGVDGFRIYLTDLTTDNIAVNETNWSATFVDMDNIVLIDSTSGALSKETHVHEQIECIGCFAYVPSELCAHQLSDINVFAVCQILIEDLYGNRNAGFLHGIEGKSTDELLAKVEQCFACSDRRTCRNRFTLIPDIIQLIDLILESND